VVISMLLTFCQVAVVADVAISICPVVGALDAYVLTEPAPEESHKPRAMMLSVLLVRFLLMRVSVVERPTNVSETLGNVRVSLAVCVISIVVDVPVVANELLNTNCFVLSVTL